MLSARRLSICFLLMAAFPAHGEWALVSCQRQAVVGDVIHLRTIVQDTENGRSADLHLALFTTKTATLRMFDQPNEPRVRLSEVMEREHCLAGVNGGYFTPEDAPLGLLIADGEVISPLTKARLLSGVVAVKEARIEIFRSRDFPRSLKWKGAVQCGPFLVERGRAISGLEATRSARRTFVSVGGDQAALGFCSSVSLSDLGKILSIPGIGKDFKIQRALNLDGGSSSAFWFASERGAFSIAEQKTVRDFVAIVPR